MKLYPVWDWDIQNASMLGGIGGFECLCLCSGTSILFIIHDNFQKNVCFGAYFQFYWCIQHSNPLNITSTIVNMSIHMIVASWTVPVHLFSVYFFFLFQLFALRSLYCLDAHKPDRLVMSRSSALLFRILSKNVTMFIKTIVKCNSNTVRIVYKTASLTLRRVYCVPKVFKNSSNVDFFKIFVKFSRNKRKNLNFTTCDIILFGVRIKSLIGRLQKPRWRKIHVYTWRSKRWYQLI